MVTALGTPLALFSYTCTFHANKHRRQLREHAGVLRNYCDINRTTLLMLRVLGSSATGNLVYCMAVSGRPTARYEAEHNGTASFKLHLSYIRLPLGP